MILTSRPVNERLIHRLPADPSDEQLRQGVRRWLELLGVGHYATAAEAVHFERRRTAASLRQQIEGYFGDHAAAVRPSEQVVAQTEITRADDLAPGRVSVTFRVPLSSGQGIWTTFQVVPHDDGAIFAFSAFHS